MPEQKNQQYRTRRQCCRVFILFIAATFFILSLPTESVLAQEKREKINIFDKKKKDEPKKKQESKVRDIELMRQMTESLEQAFNGTSPQKSYDLFYFGIFFSFFGLFLAGMIYWRYFWERRSSQSLIDPAFLVRELNSAHQLTRDETAVMQRIAEQKSLPTTLDLFVEPNYLLNVLDDKAFAPYRPITRSLLQKLFDIEAVISDATQFGASAVTRTGAAPTVLASGVRKTKMP